MMVLARRTLLALVAVSFVGIAALHVVMPAEAAKNVGLIVNGVGGLSEIRAVYVGVWLATAIIFALAARAPNDKSLYLAGTLLVAGQVFGRALSLVMDGAPSGQVLAVFVCEIAAVALLVVVRPRPRSA